MKVGLALEGGSRQTIFSAGVLDAWMDENIDFSYYCAVSAGCHAAMNYITRQRGRFRYIIQPTKIQKGMDKAHRIFDGIQKECYALHYNAAYGDMPFDFHLFFGADVECEFGLTCLETGRSEFFQEYMSEKRLLDIVNASSALPMLFPMVQIDGKHYADGCVTSPIPYQRALEKGCDKVVVVSTHYPGEIVTDFRKYRVILNPMFKRKYPDFFRALMLRYKRYEKMFAEMEKLEKKGKVMIFRPEKEVCDLFATDRNELDETYNMGFEYAKRRMDDLKAFMEI
ncbi:MAG: patatin family protein [Fibrobacter sp.]|nr:patatin family protein [Fibrobacter sp.]